MTKFRPPRFGAGVTARAEELDGVAILARGAEPVETRHGPPDDPGDAHSRYIEAAVSHRAKLVRPLGMKPRSWPGIGVFVRVSALVVSK